jgi:superfamily II DNA or RNA helicase
VVPSINCVGQFDAADVRTGQNLYEADRVQPFRWQKCQAQTDVREATGFLYGVCMDFGLAAEETIRVHCECKRYAQGRLCPHVWAAILELEEDSAWDRTYARLKWTRIRRMADDSIWNPPKGRSGNVKSPLAPKSSEVEPTVARGAEEPDWQRALQQFGRVVRQEVNAWPLRASPQDLVANLPQQWYILSIDEQFAHFALHLTLYRSKPAAGSAPRASTSADERAANDPAAQSGLLPALPASRSSSGPESAPEKLTRHALMPEEVSRLPDARDRKILALLGALRDSQDGGMGSYGSWQRRGSSEFDLPAELFAETLPLLSETGRFAWAMSAESVLDCVNRLTWEPGEPWRLLVRVQPVFDDAGLGGVFAYEVEHLLVRNGQEAAVRDVVATVEAGLVVFLHTIAPIRPEDVRLVRALAQVSMELRIAPEELDGFLDRYAALPSAPEIQFHPSMRVAMVDGHPQGKLIVTPSRLANPPMLNCDLKFLYAGVEVSPVEGRAWTWDGANRRVLRRNDQAELQLVGAFVKYPLEQVRHREPTAPGDFRISPRSFPAMATELARQGWLVVAEGRRLRMAASEFPVHIHSSGVDWFDIHAEIDFDGMKVTLPALLEAIRNRQDFVVLGDGSRGILPEHWLRRYAGLAELLHAANTGKKAGKGKKQEPELRVPRSQALLLEALLVEHSQVETDRDYRRLIDRLQTIDKIEPEPEPKGFEGQLRPYQREGLGWFTFLREAGFNGCLADDMGLGKTVQVLALLQSRRNRRLKKSEERRPSLVVVPKSLVFNWLEEASRFAPKLRVLNYTGANRKALMLGFPGADLVVTTYGTMRQDIETLKDLEFDYVILDESRAIKNAESQAARAVQLLKSSYRLAMTGTPVENHLGELWSLFQFLNPGMFPDVEVFRRCHGATVDAVQSLETLARALRPFLLRRTKEQVLTDLPEKTEKTLFCEMSSQQQQLYNELRDHYRLQLSSTIKDVGLNRAKIHVLEALLRLRQAACDPRLLNSKEKGVGIKIQTLMEQLEMVLEEGHKALVFSQFTSLLALVRTELDKSRTPYEYLDGKTARRGEVVQRFQTDPRCRVFLISLQAGGHGLNLTAADYVFILDPWWNPAVEAQAVDRAHRLGQQNPVMAYRIICKDTVEEKILELQKSKRDLADAIIAENDSLIRQLSLEDLQMLLE